MSQFEKQLSSATLVCLDGNLPVSTIDYVCSVAKNHNTNGTVSNWEIVLINWREGLEIVPLFDVYVIHQLMCVIVWYEPTDSEKACKPFLSDAWKSLSYSSPNMAELCTMNKTLGVPTPEGK